MITITRFVPELGEVCKQQIQRGPIHCQPGADPKYARDIFVIEDGYRATGMVAVGDGDGYHVIE